MIDTATGRDGNDRHTSLSARLLATPSHRSVLYCITQQDQVLATPDPTYRRAAAPTGMPIPGRQINWFQSATQTTDRLDVISAFLSTRPLCRAVVARPKQAAGR